MHDEGQGEGMEERFEEDSEASDINLAAEMLAVDTTPLYHGDAVTVMHVGDDGEAVRCKGRVLGRATAHWQGKTCWYAVDFEVNPEKSVDLFDYARCEIMLHDGNDRDEGFPPPRVWFCQLLTILLLARTAN